MREHEHRRSQRGVAKAGKPKTRIKSSGPHQRVLRLQRLAGNAVATELLTPDRVVPRDAGRPLEPVLRREMEARLGHDFSAVRLHEDADATRALGAHAYTVGTDIVFASGKYDRRRLAHELAHVVQQAHGPVEGTEVAPGVAVSDPADRHEREADAAASRALAGESASMKGVTATPSSQANVQRQESGAKTEDDPQVLIDRMNREFEERMRAYASKSLPRSHPTIGPPSGRPSLESNPAEDWLAVGEATRKSVLGGLGGEIARRRGLPVAQQRAAAEMLGNLEGMAGAHAGALNTSIPSTPGPDASQSETSPSSKSPGTLGRIWGAVRKVFPWNWGESGE